MPGIDLALWWLTSASSAILLLKLFAEKLHRKYQAFTVMLAVGLGRDLLLAYFSQTSYYAQAWIITVPVLLIAQASAALGCYRQIAALYPGMGRFAVRLFAACLSVAAFGSLALLAFDIKHLGEDENWLRIMVLAYRLVDGIAAGGLMLACLFLGRFPAPLSKVPRNIEVHTLLLAGYFTAYSITCFAKNLSPWHTQNFERIHFAVVAILYATWTLQMKTSGEAFERWSAVQENPSQKEEAEARAFFTGA